MTKRAVLYARGSTDEQAKGYSLPTQLDACQQYAAEHDYSALRVRGFVVRGAKRGEHPITSSGFFPDRAATVGDEEREIVTTTSRCNTSPSCPRS